jgi:hypothetical protein
MATPITVLALLVLVLTGTLVVVLVLYCRLRQGGRFRSKVSAVYRQVVPPGKSTEFSIDNDEEEEDLVM